MTISNLAILCHFKILKLHCNLKVTVITFGPERSPLEYYRILTYLIYITLLKTDHGSQTYCTLEFLQGNSPFIQIILILSDANLIPP